MPSSCLATSTCLLGYRWRYVSIVVCTFSPGRNSSGYLLSCFLGGLAADVTFLVHIILAHTTEIYFDEKDPTIFIRTHNTDLKNRLTAPYREERRRAASEAAKNE